MTKISSRYVSARSGSVARSWRAAGTASRVNVARIVIASRAVNSPLSSFDAVWMTCSTVTRTNRHYDAAAGAPTNATRRVRRPGDQEHLVRRSFREAHGAEPASRVADLDRSS